MDCAHISQCVGHLRNGDRPVSNVPVLATGSGGTNRADQLAKPYVVLVSFDGFRGDYLDHYTAPNFQRFTRQGVRATGLIPGFPW